MSPLHPNSYKAMRRRSQSTWFGSRSRRVTISQSSSHLPRRCRHRLRRKTSRGSASTKRFISSPTARATKRAVNVGSAPTPSSPRIASRAHPAAHRWSSMQSRPRTARSRLAFATGRPSMRMPKGYSTSAPSPVTSTLCLKQARLPTTTSTTATTAAHTRSMACARTGGSQMHTRCPTFAYSALTARIAVRATRPLHLRRTQIRCHHYPPNPHSRRRPPLGLS
mmetsp:Transcript_71986/g.142714  ORF Transcript_71986/g.142714 Transcript_71986/m.142714 type:complete len:223 (-) Transcript_71986:1688-2356(-)